MNQKASSIVTHEVQKVTPGQSMMPTWFVLTVLVIAMVVLKSFIYIKDGKRHGK